MIKCPLELRFTVELRSYGAVYPPEVCEASSVDCRQAVFVPGIRLGHRNFLGFLTHVVLRYAGTIELP